jgi:hypothetical protein
MLSFNFEKVRNIPFFTLKDGIGFSTWSFCFTPRYKQHKKIVTTCAVLKFCPINIFILHVFVHNYILDRITEYFLLSFFEITKR